MNDVAEVLREQRDFTAAYELHRQAEEMCRDLPEPPHRLLAETRYGAGTAAVLRGDPGTALSWHQQVVDDCVKVRGAGDPETVAARTNLARVRGFTTGSR
jgi:hypothetical protein